MHIPASCRIIQYQYVHKEKDGKHVELNADADNIVPRVDNVRPALLSGKRLTGTERFTANLLFAKIKEHSCIGARSVGPRGNFFTALYKNMSSVESAWMVSRDIRIYYSLSDKLLRHLKTFATIFIEEVYGQDDFSDKYWRFAQLIHDVDPKGWDPLVPGDVNDSEFELCIGGRSVFTTTLNPNSPRYARKFIYPVWVMNQTSQFNHLRQLDGRGGYENEFERWKATIRSHDAQTDPCGTPNPVLTDHGEASAFPQLAGSHPPNETFTFRGTAAAKKAALKSAIDRAEAEGASNECLQDLHKRLNEDCD